MPSLSDHDRPPRAASNLTPVAKSENAKLRLLTSSTKSVRRSGSPPTSTGIAASGHPNGS